MPPIHQPSTVQSLADAYPLEQARVRDLLGVYKGLPGGAGAFGAHMIEGVLRRADEAAAAGDVVAMIRSYQEMQDCE